MKVCIGKMFECIYIYIHFSVERRNLQGGQLDHWVAVVYALLTVCCDRCSKKRVVIPRSGLQQYKTLSAYAKSQA
jgi:hypothetical protein